MKYDIFISYSRKDSEVVDRIIQSLSQEKVKCFLDVKDIGSEDFLSVCADAILDSTLFLFIGSKNSYSANYTPDEVIFAKNHKDRNCIICYKIDDAIPPKQIELAFSALNQRDIFQHPIETILLNDILDKLPNRVAFETQLPINESVISKTHLWESTLGRDERGIHVLRDSFWKSRERIRKILDKQNEEYSNVSYDSIENIDLLWEITDIVFRQNIPLNPIEGYVLSIAFILSTPLLSLTSTKGKVAVQDTIVWKDLIADVETENCQTIGDDCYIQTLRALHWQEIKQLLSSCVTCINEYIISEEDIRRCFIGAIESVLDYSSRDWDDYVDLKIVPNRYLDIPGKLSIDLKKVTAVFRCATTIHVLDGHIPDYMFGILKNHHLSVNDWNSNDFKYRIVEDVDNPNLLSIVSNFSFSKENFHRWNVLHDTIKIIDNEIKTVSSFLRRLGLNFPYIGIAGAQSVQVLSESLPTEGWEPCNIGVHIGDLKFLIENLGGTQLYGSDDRLSVIIRELIQNGRDAIKSRESIDPWYNNGAIYIRLTKQDKCYNLEIADNGIGMTKNCVQNHLLCFGESYWSSTLSIRENPGLKSSGFRSIGHFGIGFYSLFMLAKNVKVTTRRFSNNGEDSICVEFVNGLSLLPIVYTEKNFRTNMSTVISFSFESLTETHVDQNIWYGRRTVQSDWPLQKRICYLIAGLDVDVYYSEGDERYSLIHQNVNSPQFSTEMWIKNLLLEEDTSDFSGIKLERILNSKGQLRALLSKPKEEISNKFSVISTIRGLGSCSPFYSRLDYSSMIGFIDFKSGGASRNDFVIDTELMELLSNWLLQHYKTNYEYLLKNFKLAKRYIESFGALSIDLNSVIEFNTRKLDEFLQYNKVDPFKTSTLSIFHKRIFVGLKDTYGQFTFGIDRQLDKTEIDETLKNLKLNFSIKDLFGKPRYSFWHEYEEMRITHEYLEGVGKEALDNKSLLNNVDKMNTDIDGILKRFAIMFVFTPFSYGNEYSLCYWTNYMLSQIGEKPIQWEILKDNLEKIKRLCISDYSSLKKELLSMR